MPAKEFPISLIRLIADGNFHSGEEIGLLLGVSRAAVWKRLKVLEELGLVLESVKGRGYRLQSPISLFEPTAIEQIKSEFSLPEVSVFSVLDSTNAQMLADISAGDVQKGRIIIAEQQLAGRGRRGKVWQSPFGANLYFSMGWSFEKGASQLEGLSLVVGIALQRALCELGVSDASVKWPNDLLVAGKKLAGILLEISGDPSGLCHVVIGIGVNVNMLDSEGTIDQPWTSLALLSGQLMDKNTLLCALLKHLLSALLEFEEVGFLPFKSSWESIDALLEKQVTVTMGDNIIVGDYCGLTDAGELRVKTSLGIEVFNGGEVSIRKV